MNKIAGILLALCLLAGRAAGQVTPQYLQMQPLGEGTLARLDGEAWLLLPEGAPVPEEAGDARVVRTPVRKLYLAASSAMDFMRELDALPAVRMTSTRREDWSLPEVRDALDSGEMLYAGKYSAPDYEALLEEEITLAVESTMISHSPGTREMLEGLGIPVMVERSSYESDPLGRMAWICLYGALMGKEAQAQSFLEAQEHLLQGMRMPEEPVKVAFFYLSSSGHAVVHRSGDYVSRMVEMAGGTYFLEEEGAPGTATMNMEMERFYEAAVNADVLIYNSTVEGDVDTLDSLLRRSPVLSEFTAVRQGRVYTCGHHLFQKTTAIARIVEEMNRVFRNEDGELTLLRKLEAHP